jgi:nucleotide-binding universal stress UspA family protein
MPSAPPIADRPFVLVVALDLADTDSGGYALDQAGRMAVRIPRSQMHALHVSSGDPTQETLGLLRLYVSEKLALLEGSATQAIAVHVRSGEPSAEIAKFASELSADLIVVGTHKPPHLKNIFVGSTAERIMAHATCPVVVSGPKPKPVPSHIIVIEPPCPDCVQARLDSRGQSWWCARHSEHHSVMRHHHLYSYEGASFSDHDSTVSPTGTDSG